MKKMLLPADPKANYLAHKKEIRKAIDGVLEKGVYILGEQVAAFENEFARFIGTRHTLGVASGTDALCLALRACGITQGDQVLTVSHTAVATVAAIELCGAVPVLADVHPETYTLDPLDLIKTIKKYARGKSKNRLKAVIPVHLYGHPAAMPEIMKISRTYGLRVIEDCAQSAGAGLGDRKTGSWGDFAAFSFYPTKNLGALGDGGALTTSNSKLAETAALLREYGWKKRYISSIAGTNSRLDELQAAILRVKLRYLDKENKRRHELAAFYQTLLTKASFQLPQTLRDAKHVYHQYVIQTKNRDALKNYLRRQGIGTLIHYPSPVHLQPAYRGRVLTSPGGLPRTEALYKKILSLPMYPELSFKQARAVAEALLSWRVKKTS